MAEIYVRSTDGSDADNGSTWALAKATLAGAAAIASAGDTVYVSQSHAESAAAAKTITFAGTLNNPIRVLCVDDSAEPPTALADTATVTTTGGNSIQVNGSIYCYGVSFSAGTGSVNATITLMAVASVNGFQEYENCTFSLVSTASSMQVLSLGSVNNGSRKVIWKNCNYKTSGTGNAIVARSCDFEWIGGEIVSGSTRPNYVISTSASAPYSGVLVLRGVDFSNYPSNIDIFNAGPYANGTLINCKMPASWTGSFVQGPITPQARYRAHNCDVSGYGRFEEIGYYGTCRSEYTIVRTGGASDGALASSVRLASTADASYPYCTISTQELVRWNSTVGSPITVTAEVVTDNVTLKNDECWLEIEYLGTSGDPLSLSVRDSPVTVLAASADQDTSAAAWTTTGLTTPVTQKLSVTLTAEYAGFIVAKVRLAKPSTTVYVCPKLDVS